jgi:uncharacterized membrane protein HdeD (DUF308 family)
MIKLQRYQIVNVVYYGGAALLIAAALALLALNLSTAAIVASVLGALWLIGGAAAQVVFEPWLRQWMNKEYEREREPVAREPATGETIRL